MELQHDWDAKLQSDKPEEGAPWFLKQIEGKSIEDLASEYRQLHPM